MMSEQIRLFKPFFYTEATKGMPIGIQSEADWAQTLKSMEDAKAIPSGSKPSDYFTNDCIDQAKKRLLDGNMADENALKAIDKEVKDIVAAAAQFAQDSPEPDPSELWTDVLKEA